MLISRKISKSIPVLAGMLMCFADGTVNADGPFNVATEPSQSSAIRFADADSKDIRLTAVELTSSKSCRSAYKCKCRTCRWNRFKAMLGHHCSLHEKLLQLHCRKQYEKQRFDDYLKDRFGYFKPSGCGGKGCFPFLGKTQAVYAVNPYYFDQRDGQVFAAPETGVPVAIPLAPNVHHSYNYSSGIPASRITHLSRIVPSRPY